MTAESDLLAAIAQAREKASTFLQAAEKYSSGRQGAIERRLAANAPRYAQRPSLQSRWRTEQPDGGPELTVADKVAVKAQLVEAVAAWLNSVGAEVGPDPQGSRTPEQFVGQLRLLYEWAGEPTYRELEKRAGTGKLPRSSVSDMLRRAYRLPKLDLVSEFVKACGADEALPAWIAAWERLKRPGRPVTRSSGMECF